MQHAPMTVLQKLHLDRESTINSLSTCASSSSSVITEYPSELIVRNTFLEFKLPRPASLEGFFDDRRVQSAPGSRLEDLYSEVPIEPQTMSSSIIPAQHQRCLWQAVSTEGPSPLHHAASRAEPQLGSSELPTTGSRNHHLGVCKPCAFIWKESGCNNGVECPFCHLCDSGEKKRRAKEKKAKIRAGADGLRQVVVGGISRLLA